MWLCICQWNQPVRVYILTCVLNVGEMQRLRLAWASAAQSLTRGNVESREESVPTPRRRAFGWSNTNTAALRKESIPRHLIDRVTLQVCIHTSTKKHTLIYIFVEIFETKITIAHNYYAEVEVELTWKVSSNCFLSEELQVFWFAIWFVSFRPFHKLI